MSHTQYPSAVLFQGAVTIMQTRASTVRLMCSRDVLDMELEAAHQLYHTLGQFLRAARDVRREDVQYDTVTGAAQPLLHSNMKGLL